jgi:DNA-binding SARP family transcriptional activator/tetratricopeptide (TPR) repeat protein
MNGTSDIRLLGPLEIVLQGSSADLGPTRQRRVLGLLLLNNGRLVRLYEIVRSVWFDREPSRTARNAVQVCISRLRGSLVGAAVIKTTDDGYTLVADDESIDLHRFRQLCAQGRSEPPEIRARTLRAAIALWRGPALAGTFTDDMRTHLCPGLEEERMTAVEDRIEAELELGLHQELIPELIDLVRANPTRESSVSKLMLAYFRDGRVADATALYHQTVRTLGEELGIDPTSDLVELHTGILNNRRALMAPPSATVAGRLGRPATAAPQGLAERPNPRQLPRRLHGFAGRATQLAQLEEVLAAGEDGAGFAIATLTGSAGIGKSTLALHWAHRVADQFPDGQLYVNLRGFDPNPVAMGPAEVLRGFLTSLGDPPNGLPTEVEALTLLFRSRVAGRRMLIVLDNARDAAQVRPLLPGEPSSFVVVTSRRELTGLIATEGAQLITLDVFTVAEATELMQLRLGQGRVRAEPQAVSGIVASCARLPLAIAIAAAKAVARPDVPLAAIAAELRDARSALDALTIGDEQETDVRAVFSWSYAALSPDAAALFRAFGNPLVPELSLAAAASALGTSVHHVRRVVEELVRAQLVTEANQRFRTHDLLRVYAAERAREACGLAAATTLRLVDHFLRSAWRAAVLFQPTRLAVFSFVDEVEGVTVAPLDSLDDALNWLSVELDTLCAIADGAGALGYDKYVWQVVWCIHEYLFRQGHWARWVQVGQAAVASAERTGDPMGLCVSRRGLGRAYLRLDRFADAEAELNLAVGRADKPVAEAVTLLILHELYSRQRRHRESIAVLRRAISLYATAGRSVSEAAALNNLGWEHSQLEEFDQTFALCGRALELFERAGDRHGQAATHDTLAYAHNGCGDGAAAIRHYSRALDLRREVGDRYAESATLRRLGDTYEVLGDPDNATKAWQAAWDILEPLDHPDLADLRAKLRP